MMFLSDHVHRSHSKFHRHYLNGSAKMSFRTASSWSERVNAKNRLRITSYWVSDFVYRHTDETWRRWYGYNFYIAEPQEAQQDMKYIVNMRAFMEMCSSVDV